MVNCCVYGCKSRSERNNPNITFHRFPTDLDTRNAWLRLIDRPNWIPRKYSSICSKHFEKKYFLKRGAKRLLMKSAIPTKFVPGKDGKAITYNDDTDTRYLKDDDDESTSSAKNLYEEVPTTGTKSTFKNCLGQTSRNDNSDKNLSQRSFIEHVDVDALQYPQDESMYPVRSLQSNTVDRKKNLDYYCNECINIITGDRVICVQCPDHDMCTPCARKSPDVRSKHEHHYLLRVPPRRPPDEIQMVLEAIRAVLIKNEEDVNIKPEVDADMTEGYDPLEPNVEKPLEYSTRKHSVNVDTELHTSEHLDKEIKTEPSEEDVEVTEIWLQKSLTSFASSVTSDEPDSTKPKLNVPALPAPETNTFSQILDKKIKTELSEEDVEVTETWLQKSLTSFASSVTSDEPDSTKPKLNLPTLPTPETNKFSQIKAPGIVIKKPACTPVLTQVTDSTSHTNIRLLEVTPLTLSADSNNERGESQLSKQFSVMPVNTKEQLIIKKGDPKTSVLNKTKAKRTRVGRLNRSLPKIANKVSSNQKHTQKVALASDATLAKSNVSGAHKQTLVIENMQIRVESRPSH